MSASPASSGPPHRLHRAGWRQSLRADLDRARRLDLRFAPWVVVAALVIALGTAAEEWQLVLTLAFVALAGGLYVRWPTAGIAVLLVLWTFAPLFRRLLDYVVVSPGPDLLSLAPYLATAVLGLIAFRRASPRGVPLIVIGLVWVGLAIGIPLGASDPLPLLFGLFAYGSASLAILIGYADRLRGRLVVERIFLVLLPVIAGYGLYQYFAPTLPPWDQLWLQATGFVTAGSKEAGDFRFFSVLNSPGTLATLLALLISIIVVARRLDWARLLGAGLALLCVALIGVRSAWLALAVALLVITILSGRRTLARVLALVAVLGGLYLVAGGTSAGTQVSERATSFGSLGQDVSFRARFEALTQYGPEAIAAPLGHGVGSVGGASRISTTASEPAPFEDNGYLLLAWQLGPLGFLLVVGGAAYGVVYGLRRTGGGSEFERRSLLAPLIASGVLMVAADALYGVSAVLFWYFVGALLAAAKVSEQDEEGAREHGSTLPAVAAGFGRDTGRKRILLLTNEFPLPQNAGGVRRQLGLSRALAERHEVHLLACEREPTPPALVAELADQLGGRVETFPPPEDPKRSAGALAFRWGGAVVRRRPPWMSSLPSAALASRATELAPRFDVAVTLDDIAHAYVERLHQLIPVVLDKHNVQGASSTLYLPWGTSLRGRAVHRLTVGQTRAFERKTCRLAAAVVVTSDREAERFERLYRWRPHVVPTAVAPPPLIADPVGAEAAVGWVGDGRYQPNVEGLVRFVREAWAPLGAEGATLLVAGRDPPADVQALADLTGVRVLGFVEDISAILARSAVGVVPLWAGAGIKMKTLTMMAAGLPVVGTDVGFEGIAVQDGVDAIVAEDPRSSRTGSAGC